MIPKIIHHLWIDPDNQTSTLESIPMDVWDNLVAWKNIETGYRQKIWLIDELLELCDKNKFTEISMAIRSCRFPAMQADIARLLILKVFGGFWADLKLRPNIRFLDRLSNFDLVLAQHFPKDDLPDPTGHISNSFIGAAAENVVINKALKAVCTNVAMRMPGSIYHVSGATNLMKVLDETSDRDRSTYLTLPHQTVWGYLFTIHLCSYNKTNMHWSLRELREHPYEDAP